MNTICLKCGAGKNSLKCDFCGSEESIDERKENESSTKILAEREFSVGNYKEALKFYEALYKEYPNDIYIISKRTFCLFELEKIDLEKFGLYLETALMLSTDKDTFKSTILNFLKYILGKENISILNFISKKSITKIFNDKELYNILLFALKEEEDISLASDLDKDDSLEFYLKWKYASTFSFFQNIRIIKNKIDTTFYSDILKILQSENKLQFQKERRFGFKTYYYSDISEEDMIELIKNNIKGEIPFSIFAAYFDSNKSKNDTPYYSNDIAQIIARWNEKFVPIKLQFENYIKGILASYMPEDFYLGNEKIMWEYSFPMDSKFVANKISEIQEKGHKRRRFKEQMSPNCFIATATMGSYDHPVVVDLREFRDNWLLERKWGVTFTNWYYTHGRKAAILIEKSTILKKISYFLIVLPLHLIIKYFPNINKSTLKE